MLPINLDLSGKKVLMVGAGHVGRRKLAKIIAAGAAIRLVEPQPTDEIKLMASKSQIELFTNYCHNLLREISLVFVATNQPELNRAIAEEAHAKGIWVNVADSPELSDFTLPAVVNRGLLQLTVSTGGASPALAAKIAADLNVSSGVRYGPLVTLMAELRPLIMSSGLTRPEREKIFNRLINSSDINNALAGKQQDRILNLLAGLIYPLALPANFKLPDFA